MTIELREEKYFELLRRQARRHGYEIRQDLGENKYFVMATRHVYQGTLDGVHEWLDKELNLKME